VASLGYGFFIFVGIDLISCINFVICYTPVSLALHFGLKPTPFDFDVLVAVEFQVEKVTKTELFQVLQSAVKFKNSSPQKLQTDLFVFADQSQLSCPLFQQSCYLCVDDLVIFAGQ